MDVPAPIYVDSVPPRQTNFEGRPESEESKRIKKQVLEMNPGTIVKYEFADTVTAQNFRERVKKICKQHDIPAVAYTRMTNVFVERQ